MASCISNAQNKNWLITNQPEQRDIFYFFELLLRIGVKNKGSLLSIKIGYV